MSKNKKLKLEVGNKKIKSIVKMPETAKYEKPFEKPVLFHYTSVDDLQKEESKSNSLRLHTYSI